MSVYVQLMLNATLLLSLAILYSMFVARYPDSGWRGQAMQGLLFGAVTLAGMLVPVNILPGVVFDGRSVVLAMAGLFGGPLAAAVAAAIASLYRAWLGGVGAPVGIAVIVTSALLGVGFHYLRRNRGVRVNALSLLAFGFLVHIALLAWMLALPAAVRGPVLASITLPILTVFPAVTAAFGLLLLDQEHRLQAARRIQESEERYSGFFNLSLDMMCIADTKGFIKFANAAFLRTLGYDSDQISRRPFIEFVHPEDRQATLDVMQKLTAGEALDDFENRYRTAQGDYRLLRWRAAPGHSGAEIFAVASDITDTRSVERELQSRAQTIARQNERLQKVFDNIPVMLCDIDERGVFTLVNRHFESVLGWNLESMQGRDMMAEFYPDEAYRNGVLDYVRNPPEGFSDFSTRTRDGRVLTTSWANVLLSDGTSIGIGIDLTGYRRMQIELIESEDRWRLFIEHAPVALATFDRDMNYLAVSNRWISDYKLAGRDLIGRSHYAIFPEIPEHWRQVHRRGMQGEPEQSGSELFERQDGSKSWLRWVVRPWYGVDRSVQGIVIFTEDITERKQSEDALRLSEARFRSIFDNAPLGMALVDAEGRAELSNPALRAMLGYSGAEFRGKRFMEFTHPDDVDSDLEKYRELYANRIASYSMEKRYIRRDGAVLWADLTVAALPDSAGKPIYAVGMMMDITARKQAEQASRASLAQYRTLFEYTPLGIVVADDKSYYRDANPSICKMLGYTRDEFVGLHASDIVTAAEAEHIESALREIQAAADYSRIWQFRRRDGSTFDAEVMATTLPDGQLLGIIQDITERRLVEAERARLMLGLEQLNDDLERRVLERTDALTAANARLLELDRLKSLFIASMSHELRTPLNAVIGFSGLMLNNMAGPVNAEQSDYLARINRSGLHLLHLVTDIIDISRIEADRIQAEPTTFELQPLIAEALATVDAEAAKKGLTLEASVGAIGTLHTDRKRLLQCLLNFLSNAIKYSDQGVIRVSAETVGEAVELRVSDEGGGIAESELPKLFRQFSRIDSAATRRNSGTGLGLYLTRKLAEQVLRGSVGVESAPGQGAVFKLRIPGRLDT